MYDTILEAQDEFEKCWLNPLYTPIEVSAICPKSSYQVQL
jgi:hypothetical protein